MAKSVDEIVLKTSVEGQASLDQLNAKLANIDESSKRTATTLSGFNVRNVAYQIQDVAVQLEMGTSAFRVFTQQAPQLLSAFGTTGAVIGAIAAVSLPLLQYGLKLAGVDSRSLTENLTDLTKAAEEFKKAQQSNQTTLEGLRNSYGNLSAEAKRFFDVQENLTKKAAYSELNSSLTKLSDTYKIFRNDAEKPFRNMADTLALGSAGDDLYKWWKRLDLGLTAEQANYVGEALKGIDKKKPQEAADTLNQINEYLDSSTNVSSEFKRTWAEAIKPILQANQAILELERNVKAAAEASTAFNASLLSNQAAYIGKIGDARRSYDQYSAIQLEKEQKLNEIRLQFAEKNKDGVDRSKEQAAAEAKVIAEMADKQKDFAKAQQETFYAQQLSNETRRNQLALEGKIADLQAGQSDSLNYQSQLEERVLKNIFDQQQALAQIEEMRRKNQITEERAQRLREQAGEIRKQADANAEKSVAKIAAENERAIRIQIDNLINQNAERAKSLNLEERIFGLSTIQQTAARKQMELENNRNRAIMDLNNNNKLSDAEKLDALIRINEQYGVSVELVKQEAAYNERLSKSFDAGVKDRFKQLEESYSNFKVAGMAVDAVWNGMSSSIDKFVETGKFKFKDFAASIIMDLEKIALKSALIGMFKAAGFGDLFSLPGKAAGGPVMGGMPYLVGEQGPELFVPSSAGNIVPNNRMGGMGGSTTIINNISALDAKSVAQLFAENRMTLFGTVEQARRELPLRTR